jgi:hypothetical protein
VVHCHDVIEPRSSLPHAIFDTLSRYSQFCRTAVPRLQLKRSIDCIGDEVYRLWCLSKSLWPRGQRPDGQGGLGAPEEGPTPPLAPVSQRGHANCHQWEHWRVAESSLAKFQIRKGAVTHGALAPAVRVRFDARLGLRPTEVRCQMSNKLLPQGSNRSRSKDRSVHSVPYLRCVSP